jgi:hypothetical protein
VTVRLWELATAVVIVLFGALFVVGGQVIEGVVVAALGIFWTFGRAKVPEWLGPRYLRRKASLELAKIAALSVCMLAATAASAVALVEHWNRDPEGPLLDLALIGVMVLLYNDLNRRLRDVDNLILGGNAETAVAEILESLDGAEVHHNWLPENGYGNVDHFVRRSDGEWFAIETKSGWFRPENAAQAVRSALAVKSYAGAPWVTPVVCVGKAREEVREYRSGKSRVWVVSRSRLAESLPTAPSTRSW